MKQQAMHPSPNDTSHVVNLYQPSQTPLVLAADDDRSLLAILQKRLEGLGYQVLTATNGDDAFSIIERESDRLDAILLDREMPGLKGLEVVRMMKSIRHLSRIPVIMQTAADRPEQIEEGIEAGVFYYLTKPIQARILESVLSSAIEESRRQRALRNDMHRHSVSFTLMESGRFLVRTLDEAYSISSFISHCFPEPERVVQGIADLVVNAVEHGNLGISYDEKTVLVEKKHWLEEVERRLALPEYTNRWVEIVFKRREDGCYIQITDEGEGFDWRSFLTIDASRATDNHGRGIAQANQLCFDVLRYNERGNQVIGIIYTGALQEKELNW